MTKKKVIRNFGLENGNFFLKKRHSEILVCEKFFRPPKLCASSPPMTKYQMSPEVSAKIVRFFRTALRGAEVARVRILSLGPTIYRGPRNFEPSHGIGVLPRNLTFFIRTAIFS